MKIAIFVPHLTRPKGFENNVSAHVQLPCEVARLLIQSGHQVDIISDSQVEGYTLPVCLPEEARVFTMIKETFVLEDNKATILKVFSLISSFFKMCRNLRTKVNEDQYDVIHYFGTERMLIVSKILALFGVRAKQVITFNHFVNTPLFNALSKPRFLWKQIHAVVVSMEYAGSRVPKGIPVHLIRHGIIKKFSDKALAQRSSQKLNRVLFWQTPSQLNGIDICMDLFTKLAPEYPHINFDLAVRAESDMVDLDQYEKNTPNGHVYRFPYPEGVSLEQMLTEAVCVVQPFRRYTYHPQLVILESLTLGIPVLASDLPGTDEMISHNENGFIIPLADVAVAERYLRQILDDPAERERLSQNTQKVRDVWAWEGYAAALIKAYS